MTKIKNLMTISTPPLHLITQSTPRVPSNLLAHPTNYVNRLTAQIKNTKLNQRSFVADYCSTGITIIKRILFTTKTIKIRNCFTNQPGQTINTFSSSYNSRAKSSTDKTWVIFTVFIVAVCIITGSNYNTHVYYDKNMNKTLSSFVTSTIPVYKHHQYTIWR